MCTDGLDFLEGFGLFANDHALLLDELRLWQFATDQFFHQSRLGGLILAVNTEKKELKLYYVSSKFHCPILPVKSLQLLNLLGDLGRERFEIWNEICDALGLVFVISGDLLGAVLESRVVLGALELGQGVVVLHVIGVAAFLQGKNLFADSSDLHLGLEALVLGDGKVQPHINDGQSEEHKEGHNQQQWLCYHGGSAKKSF